jgi:hypothetical protein
VLDSFGDQINASLGSVSLKRKDPKEMQRIRVRRRMPKNFAIEMLCFSESTLLVQSQALPERGLYRKCLLEFRRVLATF